MIIRGNRCPQCDGPLIVVDKYDSKECSVCKVVFLGPEHPRNPMRKYREGIKRL